MKVVYALFCSLALGNTLGPKWKRGEMLAEDTQVPMRVALKQRNLDKGMEYLLKVSDPSSPSYGKHYTKQEVIDLFAPDKTSVDKVRRWLKRSGVSQISQSKSQGWLDFTTNATHLSSILGTDFHTFERRTSDGRKRAQISAAGKFVLPRDVAPHIHFIAPAMGAKSSDAPLEIEGSVPSKTVQRRDDATKPKPIKSPTPIPYNLAQALKAAPNATALCSRFMTPKCIRDLYSIPLADTDKPANPDNRLGIFEIDDEYPRQVDLDEFHAFFASYVPRGFEPKIDLINFHGQQPNPAKAVGEAALDFDMAHPIIYPQGTELYQSKLNGFNITTGRTGVFNQMLDAVDGAYCTSTAYGETGDSEVVDGTTPDEACGTFTPAKVISFSYDWSEDDYPPGYLERQCDEFMKLGLQGSSIVFASGDGGVAGNHGGQCRGTNEDVFEAVVAAACPYVTTVGATGATTSGEVASSQFASGGGFSNVWAMPSYQKQAVSSYLANHNPGFSSYANSTGGNRGGSNGVYNSSGRAYPDIAAVGENGVVVLNYIPNTSGGTSMSAPIVAAIFTRINEERLAAGKSPIGFANPAIYANPGMFNDITSGGQGTGKGSCDGKSFSSASGWDPVTGLGTPRYPEMLKYFMGLA